MQEAVRVRRSVARGASLVHGPRWEALLFFTKGQFHHLPCRTLWNGWLPVAPTMRTYRVGLDQKPTGLSGLIPPLSLSTSHVQPPQVLSATRNPHSCWVFARAVSPCCAPSLPFEPGQLPTHLSGCTPLSLPLGSLPWPLYQIQSSLTTSSEVVV